MRRGRWVVWGRMKNPIFFAVLTVAAFWIPLAGMAQESSKVHDQMEALDDAYKAFRREEDPAKGAELAREAQAQAILSLSEVPELVKDMPDPKEKAKALAVYKKMMAQLVISLCEVEEAFLEGKVEEVDVIVDRLKDQKKEGHEKFLPAE